MLEIIPSKLRSKKLCHIAFKQNVKEIVHIPNEFITKEMSFKAVKEDGSLLKHVPLNLRSKKLCDIAFKQNVFVIEYIPDEFKTEEMSFKAVGRDSSLLKHVPLNLHSEKLLDYSGIDIIAWHYETIKEISSNLEFFTFAKGTAYENMIELFDHKKFYAELFSLIFGDQNLKILNHPAIDLADEDKKVAFQITTSISSKKIKDTISNFTTDKLYNKYDKLIVFIIGERPFYTTTFDTQNLFSFDIWDKKNLIKEIEGEKVEEKVEKIQEFLKEYRAGYEFPDDISHQNIKDIIDMLRRDICSNETLEQYLNLDDDYIKTLLALTKAQKNQTVFDKGNVY